MSKQDDYIDTSANWLRLAVLEALVFPFCLLLNSVSIFNILQNMKEVVDRMYQNLTYTSNNIFLCILFNKHFNIRYCLSSIKAIAYI